MDSVVTVVRWAETAPRGERSRAAREIGTSPQIVSSAIRAAKSGRRTRTVDKLAAWITLSGNAESAVDRYVRPSDRPSRLDSVVERVVVLTGAPSDRVASTIRDRFATVRNLFDPHEYVFATVSEREAS